MSRVSTSLSVVAVIVLAVSAGIAPVASAAELEAVLRNFDEVQQSIRTLSADFTETTRSPLLKDEIVADGSVFMTKPHSVRWEYVAPEEMRFIIAENLYTGYFPARKQAEQRDIHRWREQLFRFLGLGQASTELGKFYTITLGDSGPDMEGTVLLLLDPKKKRVRKRMEAVRFWIDEETSLPVRVEYHSKKGNLRTIVFRDMLVNPELAANLYSMELPADVKVTKGFSALSGFSSSTN